MKLDQSFTVDAPPDVVWEALIDVERVAPCLPGADITGRDDDGAYQGTFTVKLGPTTASYRGRLRMDAVDEEARRATMRARGTDRRGQGAANATIVSTVRPEGSGSAVDVDTDFTITGRLARFGRSGMIEDISRRLLADFAACLQQRLAAGAAVAAGEPVAPDGETAARSPTPGVQPAPAKPVSALRLLLGALRDRIARLFRKRTQ
jgi:uncharacterized protein